MSTELEVLISGTEAYHTFFQHDAKVRSKPGDCGTDLYPVYDSIDDIRITHHGFYHIMSVSTRIHLAIPEGHFAWVTGRSSSYDKLMGCSVIPGVIDHGYTGEYRIRIQVPIGSAMDGQTLIARVKQAARDKVALAQFIIIPFARPHYRLVEELPETKRGNDGYGSTDRKVEAVT